MDLISFRFVLIVITINSQLANCDSDPTTGSPVTTEAPYEPSIKYDDSYLPDCDPDNLDSFQRSNTFIVPQYGNFFKSN